MHRARSDETIFSEVLSLPPDQRASYLDEATKGEKLQRQRIGSLLSSYEASSFLHPQQCLFDVGD